MFFVVILELSSCLFVLMLFCLRLHRLNGCSALQALSTRPHRRNMGDKTFEKLSLLKEHCSTKRQQQSTLSMFFQKLIRVVDTVSQPQVDKLIINNIVKGIHVPSCDCWTPRVHWTCNRIVLSCSCCHDALQASSGRRIHDAYITKMELIKTEIATQIKYKSNLFFFSSL